MVIAAFACLTSCHKKGANLSVNENAPADISSLVKEYKAYLHANDSMKVEIEMEDYYKLLGTPNNKNTDDTQGLCCLEDWKITIPAEYKKNNYGTDPELMYNAYAFKRSIFSDFEIMFRSYLTNGDMELVPADTIAKAVKGMDCAFEDRTMTRKATVLRDKIVDCMNHLDEMDENNNPSVAFEEYEEYMVVNYLLANIDSAAFCNYVDDIDKKVVEHKDFAAKVAKAELDMKFRTILREVKRAKTFDEQCAIALACCLSYESYCEVWSLRLLRCLMESGRYSVLLERMWNVWKLLSQIDYCGLSRDSIIPNCSYDLVRKQIYMTVVKHLASHDGDDQAFVMSIFLAGRDGIIRNGSFIMGNDALLDLNIVCPNFYGHNDE